MIAMSPEAARRDPVRVIHALWTRLARPYHLLRARGATEYREPTELELEQIEADMRTQGITCVEYTVDEREFADFQAQMAFPNDYHGGEHHAIYREKLLEHFVAWNLLDLASNGARLPYVDIAGASSPWAQLLRDRGLEAFSVDLAPHPSLAQLPYYLKGDATATPFGRATIGSASLQCAFEMFAHESDTLLMSELARILKPGGRTVISPLYTHTHPCYYQSPEHYGRYPGDAGAARYVRRHAWGVPVSRKYSAQTLRCRVWDPAREVGLTPRLCVLRNKTSLGSGIYLHFILVLDKPTT